MARKVKATKTINPLHFEDLEPHRFEDLVRRLLYSFRAWNTIEAVGRGGSDDGFDIRAWETGDAITNVSDEGEEGIRAGEGRLWQIQSKREKTLTPAKIRNLIEEGVDQNNPPYGYILAAAANISKTAYDTFRAKLREKGVVESYFWGKDYLEDQLSLPQNDEILFTFFGLSLSPRRRSRTVELKFSINNKNRILKLLFGQESLLGRAMPQRKAFLLRDIKAEHYPDKFEYPDFDKHRRWEEHDVADVTAKGMHFKVREYYAYLDRPKRRMDYSTAVDLTPRKHNIDQANAARLEDKGKKVEHFWKHLPQLLKAKILVYGFVPFEDMLIIDEKGDPEYTDPHIHIDFSSTGPFQYLVGNLVQKGDAIHETEFANFERLAIFPTTFPDRVKGEVLDLEKLGLSPEGAKHLRYSTTLYSFDEKLKALTVGSIIRIPKTDQHSSEQYTEVTYMYSSTVGELVKTQSVHSRSELQRSAAREIADTDRVVVYELHEVMLSSGGADFYYVHNDWDS